MIKAKELRIGNRYNRKHGKGWTETVITQEIMGKIFGESLDYALNDFEPLPLTEERLLEFGFEYRNDHRGDGMLMDLNNPDWKRTFCLGKLYGKEVFTHLGTDRVELLYVHQLQNLYFVITGYELKSVI